MFSLYCVCLFPTALQELKVCRTDTYVIYPKHSNFMSIIIKDLSYTHTDKEVLFSNLNLIINSGEKTALTGNNGCGKSTLMRILAGEAAPSAGSVHCSGHLYYVPQHFGQYDGRTVAQVLGIDRKLTALHAILNGDTAEEHFARLDNDWNIEERTQAVLHAWHLNGISLLRPLEGLSGGEKTRLFLAGMELKEPDTLLLDEPTNHLDTAGRKRLYDFVHRTSATVLVISHDRTLLNLLPAICELSRNGLACYGGNYDFYKEQKEVHRNALQQQLEEKEKALRLARKTAREMEERKARQNTRGEKASIKKGIPRILLGGLKNHAENSSSKLSNVHAEKTDKIQQEITNLKGSLPQTNKLKTDFNASALHTGKILVTAQNINFHYPDSNTNLWTVPLSFQLRSGNRFCIKGDNGSGKTTLLKLITGELTPTGGTIERADFTYIYLDQEYSLIQNEYTVSEQAEAFNLRHLPEHETKTILNRYLFPQDVWNKPCSKLSGGEKMRLAFCCLMIADNTPDLFILDEPTNNLDIESIEIITATIRNYQGTVLAVSHDRDFLKETGIEQEISFFL
jgi:ATPase subunit of ABC transporter with duplicated ATPase domains